MFGTFRRNDMFATGIGESDRSRAVWSGPAWRRVEKA